MLFQSLLNYITDKYVKYLQEGGRGKRRGREEGWGGRGREGGEYTVQR